MPQDEWNALVSPITLEPTGSGTLDGMTFMVKDVFAVAGYTNGAGNPDWLHTHGPSAAHAPAIARLLAKGARLAGTTQTDELMFSLGGENIHYGTPVNPSAPGRIPGGSSSGSAVAVAAGLADFALGTDTAGSVRVPSSYCGVYGIRPTHGVISAEGVIPLAPSFDTVGWMAKDADTLLRAGAALLPQQTAEAEGSGFSRILCAQDAWSLADEECREALTPPVALMKESGRFAADLTVAPQGLTEWMAIFRTIQGAEIWREHGGWIRGENPVFAPDIAERFAWSATIDPEECERLRKPRDEIRMYMADLLGDDGLLVIPTAPGAAPPLRLSGSAAEERRGKTMRLSCIAGIAGLPQITLPAGSVGGCPVGLSVIAGPNRDLRLLTWVRQFSRQAAEKTA